MTIRPLNANERRRWRQVDFLDYVIAPMFSLLTKVLTGIDDYVKVMKENRGKYKGEFRCVARSRGLLPHTPLLQTIPMLLWRLFCGLVDAHSLTAGCGGGEWWVTRSLGEWSGSVILA